MQVFEKGILVIFLVFIFLLPLLFRIGTNSVEVVKSFFIAITSIVLITGWGIIVLRRRTVSIPRSILISAGIFIMVILIISSLLADNPFISFFGFNFEVGTTVSLLFLFLLLFLSSSLFQSQEKILYLYSIIILSFLFVFLLQFIDFFLVKIVQEPGMTIVGQWSNLAIFSGFIIILSLITLEFFPLQRLFRVFLYMILFFALVLLLFVNVKLAWIMMSVFSLLIILGHRIVMNNRWPWTSFALLFFSLFIILSGSTVSNILQLNTVSEIRPSWSASFEVIRGVLAESPTKALLGNGPNTFIYAWNRFKPVDVNSTAFWNIDFETATGLIPTLAATTGLLGILVWTLFLLMLCYTGFKALLSSRYRVLEFYFILSAFLLALYGWIWTIIYTPNSVILTLTFVVTGILIALLIKQHSIMQRVIYLPKLLHRYYLPALLSFLVIVLGTSSVYFVSKKFLSIIYFERGITLFKERGDFIESQRNVARAIRYSPQSRYYRALVEIQSKQIDELLIQKGSGQDIQKQFGVLAKAVIENARSAQRENRFDYHNSIILGDVYTQLALLDIRGAYERGKSSYDDAIWLAPHSPVPLFLQARLAMIHDDTESAKHFLSKSLELKSDYHEALELLEQLD